jgi:hypothetical protein
LGAIKWKLPYTKKYFKGFLIMAQLHSIIKDNSSREMAKEYIEKAEYFLKGADTNKAKQMKRLIKVYKMKLDI